MESGWLKKKTKKRTSKSLQTITNHFYAKPQVEETINQTVHDCKSFRHQQKITDHFCAKPKIEEAGVPVNQTVSVLVSTHSETTFQKRSAGENQCNQLLNRPVTKTYEDKEKQFHQSRKNESCEYIVFLRSKEDSDIGDQFAENQCELLTEFEKPVSGNIDLPGLDFNLPCIEPVGVSKEVNNPEKTLQLPSEKVLSKLSTETSSELHNNSISNLSLSSQTCMRIPFVPLKFDTQFTLNSPGLIEDVQLEVENEKELGVSCCDKSLKRKSEECIDKATKFTKAEDLGGKMIKSLPQRTEANWDDSLKLDNVGPVVPIKFRELCSDFSLTL